MSRTLITNVSTGPLSLPPPYLQPVAPGASVVVADPLAVVQAYLGNTIPNLWRATADDADNPTILSNDVLSATLLLTNAQIKAMKATPVNIVGPPGVGNILVPVECSAYLKYGGNNAFTANATDNNVCIKRTGSAAALLTGGAQAFLQATASGVNKLAHAGLCSGTTPNIIIGSVTEAKAAVDNKGLDVANFGAAEIAGNAAGDNLLLIALTYRIDAAPAGW